jgi:uncharacterized phage-associated protein
MTKIRFRFDQEKLAAVLAFFASRGVKDLDVLKSAKLIYFADKAHLLRYGRPIMGDSYFGMDHGPVPERSYDQIKSALNPKNSVIAPHLAEYLAVDLKRKYPQFVAKRPPDLDVLSESDVEILEEVLAKYGGMTPWQLRDLTHHEPEVQESDAQLAKSKVRSVPIPYERFFDPDRDKSIRASVDSAQADRDFAASLT